MIQSNKFFYMCYERFFTTTIFDSSPDRIGGVLNRFFPPFYLFINGIFPFYSLFDAFFFARTLHMILRKYKLRKKNWENKEICVERGSASLNLRFERLRSPHLPPGAPPIPQTLLELIILANWLSGNTG